MGGDPTHRNVELVVAALTAGGADPSRIARMRVLPDAVTTAAAAAAALGVEVGADRELAGLRRRRRRRCSCSPRARTGWTPPRSPRWSGPQRVRRASPDFVREPPPGRRSAGWRPVGHPAPLRTLVDRALATYDEVWAAGGIPMQYFRAHSLSC